MWSVLSGDNFLNDVFVFLRKLGFNDFAKLNACVGIIITSSVVFTQMLDHSVEDSIFVFVMLTNVGLWVGLQSKRNCDFLWKLFISSVSGEYRNFLQEKWVFVLCNSNFGSVVGMD